MNSQANFFRGGISVTPTNPIYNDATCIYSFRKFFNWSNAVIRIKRTADGQLRYVWFDGNTITLNSKISETETPTTTTLGDFIGSGDGSINIWYGQNPIGFNTAYNLGSQLNPLFIVGGVILTKNGLPCVNFNGVNQTFDATAFTELGSEQNFTVLSVANTTNTEHLGIVWNTSDVSSSRLAQYIDARSTASQFLVVGGTVINNLTNIVSTNQRLQTITVNTKLIKGYSDNVLQNSYTFTGTYTNDTFRIGAQFQRLTDLIGNIQEIVIFPSDKTTDLTDLHADINTYYSIY